MGEHLMQCIFGHKQHWARVVMDKETSSYVSALNYRTFKALEVGGAQWEKFGFASYRSVTFPEYDLCNGVLAGETFDIIIAEQVLEHVLYPYRAVQNLFRMLRDGGVLVVTTPFLIKVHASPVDCSRWTEIGLKHLLFEGGFSGERIVTGSWGNKECAVANFRRWVRWIPWRHSLKNDTEYPVVVWAFAQK